ncbi:hypothetical protein MB901379_00473 [Mycobacterium basiliense]|uniref:DUF3060 domain-containing protein n=1 Tax=Mycobacterium basiliense TaxID=2094119 RepID=A0A3S4BSU2_9MYCO|nr:DUF3060 domain-containing protein [Mycobacterium basiliense]VDM86944.1 hypothetical protein MB901379_00473 [Mycobacterium basiliense]
MNPEDDPEARIRQLEQPLADAARASELGSAPAPGGFDYQPYPPPPSGTVPPPPPVGPPSYGYQPPFPGATPRSSTGNRAFWIVAACFVVGILAVVGIVALYAARHISHTLATLSPTTSAISVPHSPPPRGNLTQTPTAEAPATPSPPAGSSLSVVGVNEHKTITCNDSIVSVSGVSNTVVISGHCTSLTVSGFDNNVTVDSADIIDASGLNNEVTYHSGSPKVSKSGSGNQVGQG